VVRRTQLILHYSVPSLETLLAQSRGFRGVEGGLRKLVPGALPAEAGHIRVSRQVRIKILFISILPFVEVAFGTSVSKHLSWRGLEGRPGPRFQRALRDF
jgi:hypothetical protein